MADPTERMVDECVVLETATPVMFIGTLTEVTDATYVLRDADVHDCRHGHASKEMYLAEVRREGITVNRRSVVVMRSTVICMSRLDDVVLE